MTIPVGVLSTDVRSRSLQALIGMWVDSSPLYDERSVFNSDPQAVQVDTITVNTGTNDHEYTLTVDGVEVSYTADSSTSTTEVAAGLVAAWNSQPYAASVATASNVSNVVTITGLTAGQSYVIDDVDALATLASVTAAAEADAVAYGRLMISLDYESGEDGELAVLCKASKLVAQVDTITVDYAASEVYKIQITVEGETYLAEVDADTDDATTATNIRTAINAMMPANTVIASGATDQVILTAEVAGKAFRTVVGVKSETVARLALVHTTASLRTDVNRAVVGISKNWSANESTAIGATTPSWPANQGVIVATKGILWVAKSSAETPAKGDKVYVETGVTADNGKLFNTTSATRILLTNATWERSGRTAADGLAAVRINF